MQSFRMIKPVCCREQWGIFECQLAGNKKRVTIKGTWPVLAEDLVPGSQYRAVLKTETFKGKPQYVATDPKLEKVDQPKAFALAQLLIQVDSALRPAVKKMMERSEADPNLVDRLIGADLATIRKLLSVQESTAAKILDAIKQVHPKHSIIIFTNYFSSSSVTLTNPSGHFGIMYANCPISSTGKAGTCRASFGRSQAHGVEHCPAKCLAF